MKLDPVLGTRSICDLGSVSIMHIVLKVRLKNIL